MPNTTFESRKYPRTYKPGAGNGFLAIALFLIVLGQLIQVALHVILHGVPTNAHQHGYDSAIIVLAESIMLFMAVVAISITVGYRVTLEPECIKIKSIFGEKQLLRSDIESYRYLYGGKRPRSLWFNLKSDRTQSKFDILSDNTKHTILFLTFDYDQEFYDWVASLRLEVGFSEIPRVEA